MSSGSEERKQEAPHLKVTLAVSSADPSICRRFANLTSTKRTCFRFVQSIQSIIEEYQLDGVDIAWVNPTGPIECENYVKLLAELRRLLGWHVWITTALPAEAAVLSKLDFPRICEVVDFINLMAYDFVGSHFADVKRTGHQAQLYMRDATGSDGNTLCGASAVKCLLDQGVPSRRIMLGIPLYGHSFKGATAPNQGFSGPGSGHDATHEVKDLPLQGMAEIFDANAVAAYASGNGEFITYDNQDSVRRKAEYVKRNNLRGLFYWHLAGDRRGVGSLVEEGYSVLTGRHDARCSICVGTSSQPSASNAPG